MRRNVVVVLSLLTLAAFATACASKKYVSKEVGAVNQKVETLSDSVERNQEKIGRNEADIARQGGEIREVDAKADEAGQLAAGASDEAERAFNEARKAMKGKLLYEVTLSNDKVNFGFAATELSADAQVLVDDLAEKIKADNRGLWIEIEGHTDAAGDPTYNKTLGMQ